MEMTEETHNDGQNILEDGTYEILKNRLSQYAGDLNQGLNQLNEKRKSVFGSIEKELLLTDRINTDNNCHPVDMVPIESTFIFGYNVHLGLKTNIEVSDVFSVYEYVNHEFQKKDLKLIANKAFKEDFSKLYKYYKNTHFVKFALYGPILHMVFRIGKDPKDVKTFKWQINGDTLKYVDNRSDHEFVFPDQHEFRWVKTTRDDQRDGQHPHITINDEVFVETIGGDLTVKIEDNTDDGWGIYREDVLHKDQTLDDGEIYYAIIGNIILLKIRPYQEDFRYIIYNKKIQEAKRIDKLQESCILLPDDHGIIFSNGYYLQTGEFKQFDNDLTDMLFERRIASPNGEDFMYVFYNRASGIYLLFNYNLIQQRAENPMICHGFSFFENGELCVFSADDEPKKHHAVQVWKTPFTGPNFVLPVAKDSFISKLGNKEIVRAMAECRELIRLINKEDSYAGLYQDLIKQSTDVLDSYHWISGEEAFALSDHIKGINDVANAAVDEYEKVVKIRQHTKDEFQSQSSKVDDLIRKIKKATFESIDEYVEALSGLRTSQGELISLRELRYIDLNEVDKLQEQITSFNKQLSRDCVNFLLQDRALKPYHDRVAALDENGEKLEKVADVTEAEKQLELTSTELQMLIEIVSNLKIDDPTKSTKIIDGISSIYAALNQIKAKLKRKKKSLLSLEGTAEFNAQVKLLDQSIINYLDLCDTPDKCEEYLSSTMIILEELEGKFSEFDEFIIEINEKREEIYNTFEARRVDLVESRNKRTSALHQSGERILKAVKSKAARFNELNEINGYFASDLMIEKLRELIESLNELGDTLKADDLQSKLKTQKEDTIRQLKDRKDLYTGGGELINFGKHQFTVNKQALELTVIPRNGEMFYHMTGTNFFEKIHDTRLDDTREVWSQSSPTENDEVYRAEYLAYQILTLSNKVANVGDFEIKRRYELIAMSESELLAYVSQFAAVNINGGYIKGVHDHDATTILISLLDINSSAELIIYDAEIRTASKLFWKSAIHEEEKKLLEESLKSAGQVLNTFPETAEFDFLREEIQHKILDFLKTNNLFNPDIASLCADYLFEELTRREDFSIDRRSADIYLSFTKFLKEKKELKQLKETIARLDQYPVKAFEIIQNWTLAYVKTLEEENAHQYLLEVTGLLLFDDYRKELVVSASVSRNIDKLMGNHSVISEGSYSLNYGQFMKKLTRFDQRKVPLYELFVETKKTLGAEKYNEFKLSTFKPRVLSSFVRNRLINEVYLPLIGTNLAKQIGAAGDQKRTDLMGLLLLISPPGYGKTTLMEYIANRLGVVFMKINGPAIGHSVLSLDPAEAPNATSKQELRKLNLAFEMGDNVMIYLDDIQHCHPEFLQKFISLCDAQRKIEGVYKGNTKTYDFRGKKVSVVMAGNPYTESGEKFAIPDMLANRADIYNLGDILGGNEEAFKLSYLENCFTSNAILAKAAGKSHDDVLKMVKAVETGDKDGLDLEASHTAEEINDCYAVIGKLLRVRDVILQMNEQYIYSAGQSDEYRTEPPFKLQGSYRDMNKIAEKIVPVMNDEELQVLLNAHYESESQTLTSGAEANLLKYSMLIDMATQAQQERWNEIVEIFMKKQRLMGMGQNNQIGQAVVHMDTIAEALTSMNEEMTEINKKKTKYKLLKVKDKKA